MFKYEDAYQDIVDYLNRISDERYIAFGTTREEVMNDEEKLEELASEHHRCVTRYRVDRKWSCQNACESDPGFWRDEE